MSSLPLVGSLVAGAVVSAAVVGAVVYTAMDALGINKMVGDVVSEVS
ncbi:MAG: hypothetical protein WC350_05930 [Candidatus Micrarchaeia archaeon]